MYSTFELVNKESTVKFHNLSKIAIDEVEDSAKYVVLIRLPMLR